MTIYDFDFDFYILLLASIILLYFIKVKYLLQSYKL